MKFGRRFGGRRAAVALLGTAALGTAMGALAAVKYVNTPRLDVVDKKRSVAAVVVTIDQNTPVNVIAKEGRWYKIEVNGKQGYATEAVLSDQRVGAKAKTISLGSIQGGSNPVLDNAAAGKGVTPGAQKYASGKGYSTDPLLELQARRESVTPDEFERFLRAGGAAQAEADGIGVPLAAAAGPDEGGK